MNNLKKLILTLMLNRTIIQLLQSKHTSNTKETELKTGSKHIKNTKNETMDWMTDWTAGLKGVSE